MASPYRSSPLVARVARSQALPHEVYMNGRAGPFKCSHCSWYPSAGRCGEPHILQLAGRGLFGLRLDGTHAVVDPDGCSDFYHPKKG